MRLFALAVALASTVWAAPGPQGPDKKLVLLFTGDNGGEVAPCG